MARKTTSTGAGHDHQSASLKQREAKPCPEGSGKPQAARQSSALVHQLYHGDCVPLLPTLVHRYVGKVKLIYLDPPYNTKRYRGARRNYKDRCADWCSSIRPTIEYALPLLDSTGFLAVSINQTELFNLKPLIDAVFGAERFVGLFPIKIRHVERQLMINATFHDVFEYLLIYRRERGTRFHTVRRPPRLDQFKYVIKVLTELPEVREIKGKKVEIYRPHQYELSETSNGEPGFRRYVIAGKLATANWSGEWYESHLRRIGTDLLIRVWGLECDGLGYRWFQTGNERRRSGVYFQSLATAGRPILPSNDIDYTEVVPTIYREGGPGCDFKDSKKPEALLQMLMDICTKPGDLVMDFYAGSGTTLAVGIKSDRQVITIENDPSAFEVICTRLQNLRTGQDVDAVRRQFKIRIHN